ILPAMTRTIWILIALVSAIAFGGPAAKPPKPPTPVMPTPAEQQQINDLQKQMYELQGKGAYVPATKLAKQLVEIERKIYGDDSKQDRIRKQALSGLVL